MPRKTDIPDKLRRLRAFYHENHRMPGYTEMLDVFDYRSKNAVFNLILKLEEMGYVSKTRDGKLAPTSQLTGGIKILGSVQAGFPSPAEEELVDTLSLDDYLIRRPEATFMLTVSGESMIDAGIHPGDLVLIEKGKAPKSGDIVIAQVDGEWTMKYFVKTQNGVRLDPANKKFKPIIPEQTLEIGGIVTSVVRKYE